MISIFSPTSEKIIAYAQDEVVRLLRLMTKESITTKPSGKEKSISLALDSSLKEQEISIESTSHSATLRGGSPTALLHAAYTFLQELGCVFEFSGELIPPRRATISFPKLNIRHTPSFAERGIRMHLNFVQDQSYFTENEFSEFINNMAKQRLNYLGFHMYTPLQWFPFSYRGVEHLDQNIGGKRSTLPKNMIGRNKVKVKDHWFPREFESIRDPRKLMHAMQSRFQKMMALAHDRGIRNYVSFEPEALPTSFRQKLAEWTGENIVANHGLNQEWQEGWSGAKLIEPDVRHPLIIDITVERCLQCAAAFPDLDEIQMISTEGTKWNPKGEQTFETELCRLAKKFGLTDADLNRAALATKVPPDEGHGMMPQARPYWTVLPGDDFYATVIGSLRFVEHAIAVLNDSRVQKLFSERGIASSIAVYSPNPETVRLMMPAIAKMLPKGTRFHCLGDYGARDIAENLPTWKPLVEQGQKPGVISWLEFDGIMTLAQGWVDSISENINQALDLGAQTIHFNHWRVRSLEHNAAAAAALTWDASQKLDSFKDSYFGRLFGTKNIALAKKAYQLLEEATLYTKSNGYNVGFTADWVFRTSSNPPGYYWARLLRIVQLYEKATAAFSALAKKSTAPGKEQARYMTDICQISVWHVQAVYHLQNAKLPLVGYKAWPLNEDKACGWPPPDQLKNLAKEALLAIKLEEQYMHRYAKWVKSCDEQGQLCNHQIGVMTPFENFSKTLAKQLATEQKHLLWLKKPLKNFTKIDPQ